MPEIAADQIASFSQEEPDSVHADTHAQYLSSHTKIEVLGALRFLHPGYSFPDEMSEADVREYLWATHNGVY